MKETVRKSPEHESLEDEQFEDSDSQEEVKMAEPPHMSHKDVIRTR